MRDSNLYVLGQQIRRVRKAQNVSQEKLALSVGLNKNYVGLIERGERNATAKTLLALAFALDVSPSQFFENCVFPNKAIKDDGSS